MKFREACCLQNILIACTFCWHFLVFSKKMDFVLVFGWTIFCPSGSLKTNFQVEMQILKKQVSSTAEKGLRWFLKLFYPSSFLFFTKFLELELFVDNFWVLRLLLSAVFRWRRWLPTPSTNTNLLKPKPSLVMIKCFVRISIKQTIKASLEVFKTGQNDSPHILQPVLWDSIENKTEILHLKLQSRLLQFVYRKYQELLPVVQSAE